MANVIAEGQREQDYAIDHVERDSFVVLVVGE